MTRPFIAICCLVASLCAQAATIAREIEPASVSPPRAEYTMTDRLIVRLKSDSAAKSTAQSASAVKSPPENSSAARATRDPHAEQRVKVTARLQSLTSETLTPLRTMGDGAHVIQLNRRMPMHEVSAIAQRIAADPEVLDVHPDRLFFPQATPTDPQYVNQWNLSQTSGINMPSAWDITTGSPNLVIGILDTGMLPHNDLAGRWIGGYDFVSLAERSNDGSLRDSNPADPGDWVTMAESASGPLGGCPVTDSRWHGTTMAGIIAANANNGIGIAGINWNSKILPVRVVGKCGGYESDIADGLRWAAGLPVSGVPINPNPAQVINMSLAAGGACSTTLQNAIDAVIATNTPIIAAAGNQSANASGYSPGNCSSVITVGAVDRNGGKPTYTNFGTTVSISAPGGLDSTDDSAINVLTTQNQGATTPSANNDYYRTTFGTSVATAQVTGIVSLMLSINPTLTPQKVKDLLQNSIRAFPSNTTAAMPNPSQADCTVALCGTGIANAAEALNAVTNLGSAVATATVVGGEETSAALRVDGTVWTWGRNYYGTLGHSYLATGALSGIPVPG